MIDASGYIKRFKSLSLLIVGATLLTYDVFDSNVKLGVDYKRVQKYFLIGQLIKAKTPENATISFVNSQPAGVWLKESKDVLPNNGYLIGVINSWNKSDFIIKGDFRLSNGESVNFTRLPNPFVENTTKLKSNSKDKALNFCLEIKYCHFFSLKINGENVNLSSLLLFSADVENAVSNKKKTWKYLDDNDDVLLTVEQLESRAIGTALTWVGSVKNAEHAYMTMREKLQKQTVRIPVVNLEVNLSRASAFLSVFSLIITTLLTHSLIAISNSSLESNNEPWIIRISEPLKVGWSRKLQLVLSLSGTIVTIGIIWCPIAINWIAIGMSKSVVLDSILIIVLAFIFLFSIISSIKLINIFSKINKT